MLMRSKHNGSCETCGGLIAIGSLIFWNRYYGAHHISCWDASGRPPLRPDAMTKNGSNNGNKR